VQALVINQPEGRQYGTTRRAVCSPTAIRSAPRASRADQGRTWGVQVRSTRARSAARSSIRVGVFIPSARAVALPVGVSPTISSPSSRKWSSQASRRGLKRGTMRPDSGSIPVRFGPLCRLQWLQARARFSESSTPPCCRGTICPTWNMARERSSCSGRQYSQRPWARHRTKSRLVRPVTRRRPAPASRGP
jgi:hypothetical protein